MGEASALSKALERGLAPGGDLSAELGRLGDIRVTEKADSRTICLAVARLAQSHDPLAPGSLLHPLASLFQEVAAQPAHQEFLNRGLPDLIRIFQRESARPLTEEQADDLLFLLKVFILYESAEGTACLVSAARQQIAPDSFVWGVVFDCIDDEHPQQDQIVEGLRNPLPTGFCGVSYLDFVNRLATAGRLAEHPFDTPAGRARLKTWLEDDQPETYSYAHSAAAALRFLQETGRAELIALATEHPEELVQLEGAAAAARFGNEAGVQRLAELCLDPRYSLPACTHLRELGRDEVIPAAAEEPDFEALAEMCTWLADPQEFADFPDEIETYDSRRIYWPPSDDIRQLWLFRFKYIADEDGEPDEEGIGMVGSVTYALVGETYPGQPADDIYGLHCCFELRMNNDPRAPLDLSAEAGKQLIAMGETD